MKVALVHPPTCDPTAPYVAVPILAACLRRAGFETIVADANAESWDALLRAAPTRAAARAVRARFAALDGRASLSHEEALSHVALWDALPAAARAPAAVEGAVATLRDPARFFDAGAYGRAADTIDDAAALLSAAAWPISMDFTSWRSPFAMLDPSEVAADAARDPFRPPLEAVAERLARAGVGLVGVSVAFPGQVQPAFTLAHELRRAMPHVALAVGGPALTQLLLRVPESERAAAIAPFDAAVLFEGEDAVVDLARAASAGRPVRGVVTGSTGRALADVPAPDFDGLLGLHLSPEPVLPYDPSRGCWWGRCAFCHYGLAESGTSCYRERPAERVVADLAAISTRHGARLFHFSNDSIAPRLALDVARRLAEAGAPIRWASDLRPDRALGPARCRELAAGGALGFSLGIESGAARVSRLMDKGAGPETARATVRALAAAGIAAEAMTFTGFPTETAEEALETVRFLREERPSLALFICGEFALTAGSRVAADPARYGVAETWTVRGDAYRAGLFWREERPHDDPAGRGRVDSALARLSRGWRLRGYPWAGSLSTAHSLLWYDRFGPGVFRDLASAPAPVPRPIRLPAPRHDPERLRRRAGEREAANWHEMTNVRREVSRELHARLAAGREGLIVVPPAKPRAVARRPRIRRVADG